LAAALVVVLASTEARAESPAEASFQEGRRLFQAGQTDEACARFAESYAMVASSGTLLNLALCHQTQGKTATAWNEYRAAARLARNQGREDRATVADGQAKQLEPALARVTTTAVDAVAGLRVATEAGPLGEGGLGAEIPIDPGTHQVIVTAPGHLPWKATLEVKVSEQVALEIPRLEPEPLPPPLAREIEEARLVKSQRGAADSNRGSPVVLYLAGGGGVALIAGTVFWSLAYGKLDSAKEACTAGCSQADYDARVADITTFKNLAIGSWIAGGALATAAGVYFIVHKKKSAPSVAFAPSGAGFLLSGSF
jgi:hypothetical protein